MLTRAQSPLRRLGLLAVVAGLLAPMPVSAAGAAPPPYAAPDSSGTLEIRAAGASGGESTDPGGSPRLTLHAKPGQSVERWVEVVNPSRVRQQVTVYPGAAAIENHAFTFANGRSGNALSGWTRVQTPGFRLAPKAKKSVRIQIRVPKNAARGERYAVLWAQIGSAAAGTAERAATQVRRSGLRVYLNVGTGKEPQPNFEIVGMRAEQTARGMPVVVAELRNNGLRAVNPQGTLRLSTASGPAPSGAFTALGGVTIAPNSTGLMTVPLHGELPSGPWDVEFAVASGAVLRESKATLSLPGAPAAATPDEADSDGVPVLLLVSAGALLLVLLLFLVVRRRRTRQPAGAHRAR
ncbi:hypothetical protein O7626_10510 [Micromonospora sp. WMMD1102]|uniref:hypothetical protein n=1 Tax=Micromonospora sp. WMMD1102 TaxID=3016105 RepID=UPI0024152CD5|nr:hypothetical protein [Micromonospora sp. WMMD1102]MDG4786355.1 hypothetical protein [Micromonospora sp. WMMD1102]